MADENLTSSWIKSPLPNAPLGFGVTAFSLNEALTIISQSVSAVCGIHSSLLGCPHGPRATQEPDHSYGPGSSGNGVSRLRSTTGWLVTMTFLLVSSTTSTSLLAL